MYGVACSVAWVRCDPVDHFEEGLCPGDYALGANEGVKAESLGTVASGGAELSLDSAAIGETRAALGSWGTWDWIDVLQSKMEGGGLCPLGHGFRLLLGPMGYSAAKGPVRQHKRNCLCPNPGELASIGPRPGPHLIDERDRCRSSFVRVWNSCSSRVRLHQITKLQGPSR